MDSTGIRIKDKTVRYAVEFVTSHTSTKDSRDKKLKKCYDYLWKNYKYKRYYIGLYPKAGDMSKYAKQMFSDKKGNCHRYAACFAYIARVLGYDSQVVVGQITSRLGGMTPHGWTLVKNSGKWYVCDPDMELNGAHSYMKTYTSYRTTVTRKCTLTIKNGKVSWK